MSVITEMIEKAAEAPLPEEEVTLSIGGEPVTLTVRGIRDCSALMKMGEEMQARGTMFETTKDGKKHFLALTPTQVMAFLAFSRGIVVEDEKERPSFEEVVELSRHTGMDVMNAGMAVIRLSGMIPETVDEVKND